MRLLLICAFLVSLSVLANSLPRFVETANDCAKRNHVKIKDARGILLSYRVKSRTHRIKCFVDCVFEQISIMDVVNKRFKPEDSQPCLSIKNDDKCVESFHKFECFVKVDKKYRHRRHFLKDRH
ncbi:uncharacterized protein LOC108032485 [Drosophila biarmipes]|uniref:uncharacterized protein LOC108032485 n=1 Tax=Drosophila biarmipes TaxID=125945 RepID=UPI0007E6C00E|nr:uncharacterized protein LOC108032485 [Drosophila biarmipes]